MANKKFKDKNIRKLTKVGSWSYGITIPIGYIKDLGWKEKQKLVVKKIGNRIIISDWEQ